MFTCISLVFLVTQAQNHVYRCFLTVRVSPKKESPLYICSVLDREGLLYYTSWE